MTAGREFSLAPPSGGTGSVSILKKSLPWTGPSRGAGGTGGTVTVGRERTLEKRVRKRV